MKTIFSNLLFLFGVILTIQAQTGTLSGIISSKGEKLAFVTVLLNGTSIHTTSNQTGTYKLEKIPFGIPCLELAHLDC